MANPELRVTLLAVEDGRTGDEVYQISGAIPRADTPKVLRDLADLLETGNPVPGMSTQ